MLYFRSSLGIDFPKAPYIGQIHYDPDKNNKSVKQIDKNKM